MKPTTAILGLLTSDGAALVSDLLMHRTSSSPGGGFLLAEPARKIHPLGNKVLLGVSGEYPLTQPIVARLKKEASSQPLHAQDVVNRIRAILPGHREDALHRYTTLYGPDVGADYAPKMTLLVAGLDAQDQPMITIVNEKGDLEETTPLRYGFVGSTHLHVVYGYTAAIQFHDPTAPLESAEALAYSLMERIADEGLFHVRRPLEAWSLSRDRAPANVTARACRFRNLLKESLARAIQDSTKGIRADVGRRASVREVLAK